MSYAADFLLTPVGNDAIGRIVGTLGFASSLITFVSATVLQRPSMVRWRGGLFIVLLLQWSGILLGVVELIRPIDVFGIPSLGIKAGLAIWIVSIAGLLVVVSQVMSLAAPIPLADPLARIGLRRRLQPFTADAAAPFGVPFMDRVREHFASAGKRLRFPILIVHDRTAPGFSVGQAFIAAGLRNGEGAVYLAFTRPAHMIVRQMSRQFRDGDSHLLRGLYVVDCYSSVYLPDVRRDIEAQRAHLAGIQLRDPRNPSDVYKGYRAALLALQQCGHASVRVLYDSLSDFLFIADQELVANYLRHTIVWEELHGIQALHLLWPGVAREPLSDDHVAWISNSVVSLTTRRGCVSLYDCRMEAPGREPMTMTVDHRLTPVALQPFMIDEQRVERLAAIVARLGYRPVAFDDPRLFPPFRTPSDHRHYLFFLTAIDHNTHPPGNRFDSFVDGTFFHGSDLLYRLACEAAIGDPDLFTPERMRHIDVDHLRTIFTAPNGRVPPDMETRALLLQDAARRLVETYAGDIKVLFERAQYHLRGRNGSGIIERLAEFEAYGDRMGKKTFLLVKLLRRQNLLMVADEWNMQVPVDPVVMTAALRSGLVQCTDEQIRDRLAAGESLDEPVREELRQTTALAFKRVATAAGVPADVLDDLLWGLGREVQRTDGSAKAAREVTTPLDAAIADAKARQEFLSVINGLGHERECRAYTVARSGGGWFY
jgi:hypothetical protein